jgi:cytochrome c551/c552
MLSPKILLGTLVVGVSLFATSAETLIEQNGCLACHAVASKKAAPAFAGIGMRNKRFEGASAKEVIMNSIKNGSKGKYRYFASSAMPPFANLSDEELSTIADYILAQSSKARGHGRGMGQGGRMGSGMGGQGMRGMQ